VAGEELDIVSYNDFIQRIEILSQERGINKTNALKESGAGKDFIANIKKRQKPSLEKTVMLADYFNVSIDYLVYGKEVSSAPELHVYHWEHPDNDTSVKLYNAVCKSVYILLTEQKADALLSAIRFPTDSTVALSKAQLNFIAFELETDAELFNEEIMKFSKSEIIKKAGQYSKERNFCNESDLVRAYPEAEQWIKDYKRLYIESFMDKLDLDCFEQIANTLTAYRYRDQKRITALFDNAVKQYEDNLNKESELDAIERAAERKGEVS